jgi:hypothetical protein
MAVLWRQQIEILGVAMRTPNAALVCAVFVLSACSPRQDSGADVAAELTALKSQVAQLQNQAQAATDWTAVANLQATYGYYVDKMRWDDAADLFAKDATLEIAGRGLFRPGPYAPTCMRWAGPGTARCTITCSCSP